ncbi:katanin p60 ATPase-containing subunit A-like 2 isoform X5 [Cuculus canorus]|uniref:katanin p60 ATPase-containing subunit A-like 2 isoform X5 n=1 Tax=Cuculus canorus TaxID=55661 RepID=UPI0023AB51BE|nr:katanin p60 ATPase-containing subunit A-like 2 isoform X5 [Cuculus canorus]
MELPYSALRAVHHAREADEMRTEARRKNLLILILHYLMEEGYVDAANALEQETKLNLRGFEVCDNIDLETILMEYESYYFVKFQKYPKITKKFLDTAENKQQLRTGVRPRRTASFSQTLPKLKHQTVQRPLSKTSPGSTTELKSSTKESPKQKSDGAVPLEKPDFGLSISAINKTGGDSAHPRRSQIVDFHGTIQDAVKISSNGIALNSLNYDPDPSERLLKPLSSFIGMSGEMRELATVVSKVQEKLCLQKLLPQNAKQPFSTSQHPPLSANGGAIQKNLSGGEHEGSRRMKTELLVQMDGLARSDDLVFVLAASNLPWELDSAMLRRLEKRILVDLPSKEARQVMIQHWLPPLSNSGGVELRTDLDYSLLGQETEGYSGSDIKLVCKEAAMRPVRKIFDALENHQPGNSNLPMIRLDTITTADFLDVIAHTKPSAKNLSQKYTAWQREFESV